MPEFDVAHATVASAMVVPPASFTVAASDAVSPIAVNDRLVGDKVTLEATCDTVAVAVPLAEPEVAVIVAEPSVTPVTSPASETVATPVASEAHDTVASATTLPAASFTVAVTVAVSPIDVRPSEFGDNSTLAAV
jgi:hypothetical protein